MENKKKISMLTRMYSAITDFRIYPFVQKEKLGTAISYFLKLIAIMTLAITIYIFSNAYKVMDKMIEDFNSTVPNFVLENGTLSAENKMEYSLGDSVIIMDTDYDDERLKEASTKETIGYGLSVLISNEGINAYSDDTVLATVKFSDVNSKITKQAFYNEALLPFKNLDARVYFSVMIYISVFFACLFLSLTSVVVAMILAMIFNIVFGNRIKFGGIFKIVAYALTLPIIIQTLAFILTGTVSNSVRFIYQALVCIYVFYALRALMLEKVIVNATKGGVLQKIINMNKEEEKTEEKPQSDEQEEKKNDEDKKEE